MNIKSLYTIPIILSFLTCCVYAQNSCETPLTPAVLTSVSVQPETGLTELNWTLSPDQNISAYIIYSYRNDQGSRGDPIDTVWNPAQTIYSYTNQAYKYYSSSFVITAYRLPRCEGPFSNIISTMFTKVKLDTCNKKILVSWNSYPSYPKNVLNYSVLVSVNGGNLIEAGKVPFDSNSFTLTDFEIDAEYFFVIRANLEGGYSSTSNGAHILTKMQKAPKWINADYATVNEYNDVSLSFSVDPSSEIDLYSLEKKAGSSGTFQEIAPVRTEVSPILYTDESADLTKINFYRLSAINNCNIRDVSSNLASNIKLETKGSEDKILLRWNKYYNWLGTVSSYLLFADMGNGFTQMAVLDASDTTYSVKIPDIMYNLQNTDVCFYISAKETSNPYNIDSESHSNKACFTIDEIITVPEVFTPDGNLKNDLFRPVLTFTPDQYHLVITSTRGKKMFETNNFTESWDGTYNGNPVPDGPYLWFIKVKTSTGRTITRTGTITVFKNR